PVGGAVMDWLSVLTLALAVLDSLLRGRRVAWTFIALWLVGAGFAVYQGGFECESLRIGGNWIGAIALGLAAMHLGSHMPHRRIIIAALIGLLISLAGQAVLQVTVEHAQSVKNYQENREKELRKHGWEPD